MCGQISKINSTVESALLEQQVQFLLHLLVKLHFLLEDLQLVRQTAPLTALKCYVPLAVRVLCAVELDALPRQQLLGEYHPVRVPLYPRGLGLILYVRRLSSTILTVSSLIRD